MSIDYRKPNWLQDADEKVGIDQPKAVDEKPSCPKCGKPMEEQDTWTDVHHYVCLGCNTERTPIRK